MSGFETRMRELLEVAAGEPPRSVSLSEVRRRASRRKTLHGAAAVSAVAGVLLIAVAAIVIPGALKSGSKDRGAGALGGPTAYVATSTRKVVPINMTTNKALKAIRLKAPGIPLDMAISPNGKTLYVLSAVSPTPAAPVPAGGAVTPISTATDRAGRPIRLRGDLQQILITPNGQTAYVLAAGTGLVPIDLSTWRALPEIKVRNAGAGAAMLPNGKTIYLSAGHEIVPVDLSTATALKPIVLPNSTRLGLGPVISPSGATLYENFIGLVPHQRYSAFGLLGVNTATNTALKPIMNNFAGLQLAFGARGATLYWAGFNSVLPVDTTTNKPLKRIRIPGTSDSYAIASSPDASTVYAADQSPLGAKSWAVRINTATNKAGTPISLGPGYGPFVIAVAPDGSACIGSDHSGPHGGIGYVTVIRPGSATADQRIRVDGAPQVIVVAP